MEYEDIIEINNELKVYVNEANFISDKVMKKLLKLVSKYFYVNLPIDDFFKIDIEIMENGNVKMKGEEYESTNKASNFDEIVDRYNYLKKELNYLLNKKEINFDQKRIKNDRINFLVVLLFSLILIGIIYYSITQILHGNILGIVWMTSILIPIITPKIRDRYNGAIRYLKHIFKIK